MDFEQKFSKNLSRIFPKSDKETSLLVFYFSGHGEIQDEFQCILLASGEKISTNFLIQSLKGHVDAVIFILDCCRNMNPEKSLPDEYSEAAGDRDPSGKAKGKSQNKEQLTRIHIYATDLGEPAYEGKNAISPFTSDVIKIFRSNPLNTLNDIANQFRILTKAMHSHQNKILVRDILALKIFPSRETLKKKKKKRSPKLILKQSLCPPANSRRKHFTISKTRQRLSLTS